jgi:hypothetical protein
MEKQVFEKILACIPANLKKYKMSIALNIYLTWCGIRTGCIPFDSNTYIDPHTPLGKECITQINKIDGIHAIGGPYYDVGECIVIYNTNSSNKSKTELVLKAIATARSISDKMVEDEVSKIGINGFKKSLKKRQQAWKNLGQNKTYKEQQTQIHLNMGKLLGYQCQVDLSAPGFYDNPLYSIKYEIPTLLWSFGFWCPQSSKQEISECIAKLNDITAAFEKLEIPEIRQPELKIQIVYP